MKNKVLVLILILILCGCSMEKQVNDYTTAEAFDVFYIHTDEETCVEYFVSYSSYNQGNFSPRYNADGTLKLNEVCVNEN